VLYALQLLGVAAFAISGVEASRSKSPDIVGAFILAFATALGGAAGLLTLALRASLDVTGVTIAAVTINLRLLAIRFDWKLAPIQRDEVRE